MVKYGFRELIKPFSAELNSQKVGIDVLRIPKRSNETTLSAKAVSNLKTIIFNPMTRLIPYAAILLFVLPGCQDEHITLNANKHQTFEGSFELKTDDKSLNASGTSTLEITNGYYKGFTYEGNVLSAGRLEITNSKITFMDTVFKAWPANILPPTYLKGTYDYAFDGTTLEIGNKYESGWIEKHTFHLKK